VVAGAITVLSGGAGPGGGAGVAGSSAGSSLASTGTVTGYIEPCAGLGLPGAAKLPHPGGTVRALAGRISWRPIPGGSKLVLPAVAAATERISAGQKYLFRLAPGHYVIAAHYDGGAFSFVSVSVRAGLTMNRNLPDLCK